MADETLLRPCHCWHGRVGEHIEKPVDVEENLPLSWDSKT